MEKMRSVWILDIWNIKHGSFVEMTIYFHLGQPLWNGSLLRAAANTDYYKKGTLLLGLSQMEWTCYVQEATKISVAY